MNAICPMPRVLACLLAAAVLSGCGKDEEKKPAPPPAAPPTGAPAAAGAIVTGKFEERAKAAGITFHMNFLPEEQGEHFKINFYDHGTAVAVGDYDADGRDDLYF